MRTWRDPVVGENLADDCKPFIKDEPHKTSKIEAGRYRLITAFSLEDKIIDAMLFGPWITAEVTRPIHCVQKAGWSITPYGYVQLRSHMPRVTRCLATDKTAWDWTCPGWVVDYYWDCKTSHHRESPDIIAAMKARFGLLYGTGFIFRFPDGRRLRQNFFGMMKSGSLLTLSLNSLAQAAMHWLACLRLNVNPGLVWAMGDDLLTYVDPGFPVEEYLAATSKMGALVKFSSNRREFAGMLMHGTALEPLWQAKHKYVISHLLPSEIRDYLEALLPWYARSSAQWFKALLERYGFSEGAIQAAQGLELRLGRGFRD